ncbi:hypothetical protein [Butyrivibrio sp. FCS014]|uniref:hypothetical protein n=1 Tax=Butyrivibrio sp. FCS014 TaxID=1408304 RepID=UPI0004660670|nr:hypothetical protein [Butyrivibrio sp. FCS014]
MIRNKIVISVIICLLTLGTAACGAGSSDGFLYTKRVSDSNGQFEHGELYQKRFSGTKKVDDIYLRFMTKVDDDTVLGVYGEGPGTDSYVATYNLKEKSLTKITQVANIEEQRISATSDLSTVCYGDKDNGIVLYDLSSGESKVIEKPTGLKEPMITGDGKTMFYISDWNLITREVGKKVSGGIIASNVHTYALSNDEKFIIFTRLGREYNSILYKLDLETGEETYLKKLDNQAEMISISSDNTEFAYVTYTTAFFSSWGRTVLNVCDLKTGKSKVAFKSGFAAYIPSIILF